MVLFSAGKVEFFRVWEYSEIISPNIYCTYFLTFISLIVAQVEKWEGESRVGLENYMLFTL